MATELVPYGEMERMATAVAKSGLFGMKTPEQALSLMLIAQAEGLHPAVAARDYHVIQGRPALKADAMLARFHAAGGKVKWLAHTDTRVAAEFSHPNGGTLEIDWTMERAKQAGLAGKDNWRTYPRQMLRARVISEGIRAVYPGVAVGIYTPEEVIDFDTPPPHPTPKADPKVIPAQTQTNPAPATEHDPSVALGFGKHKDVSWRDIATAYLEWLLTKADPTKCPAGTLDRARAEMARREREAITLEGAKDFDDSDKIPYETEATA